MKKACRWIGAAGILASVAAAGFGLKVCGSEWIWAATFCFSQAVYTIGRLP